MCSVAQTSSDTLPGVKLRSGAMQAETLAAYSFQRMDSATLATLAPPSVAEAAAYFPGVLLKDYGGLGGLKTINIRGLGSAHSQLLLDGMPVNNAQAGSVDFGKYSAANIRSVELYNASPENLLLPAKAFNAPAGLALQSITGSSTENKKFKASAFAGSFDSYGGSLLYKSASKNRWQVGLSGEVQTTKGDYPYQSYENTKEKLYRKHGAGNMANAMADVQFSPAVNTMVSLKLLGNRRFSELPGAVILYTQPDESEVLEKDAFGLLKLQHRVSSKGNLLVNMRYTGSAHRFKDDEYPNYAGYMENDFRQFEQYFSSAYTHQVTDKIQLAAAGDIIFSSLERKDSFDRNFPEPRRREMLTNLGAKYTADRVLVTANLLYNYLRDKASNSEIEYRNLLPSIGINLAPFRNRNIRLRAFAKKSFRQPGFNDLYYTLVGNTGLRPEQALQMNAGISAFIPGKRTGNGVAANADIYYNRIKDKIMAVPRLNLYQWSMMNVGKAAVLGSDLSLDADFVIREFSFKSTLNFSLQQARDITNPASPLFKKQLAYTPATSGNMLISATYKAWQLSYHNLYSGERYINAEALPAYLLDAYIIHNAGLGYTFSSAKTKTRLLFEARNFSGKAYEVVKYYPMPMRQFKFSIFLTSNNINS